MEPNSPNYGNSKTLEKLNQQDDMLQGPLDPMDMPTLTSGEKLDTKPYIEEKEKTNLAEQGRKYGPLQGIVDIFNRVRPGAENPDSDKAKKELDESTQKIEGMTIQDIVAPIDLEVDFNHLEVGEWYFKSFFISGNGYPRYVGPNWLSPIINFEHSLRISTFYYPVDSKVVLQKLKQKRGEIEATLYSQMEGRKAVDPSLKVALSDIQQLQDAIAEGVEKYFHFGMYITIQSKDKDELEKISKNVQSTLASMNVTAKAALLQQEQAFITTQPLGIDKLFITRNMDTTSLATTFPFVTSELTMDHGIMYGINQHNRSLVVFDRFEMENANTVVFAKSGAGKSYFVKIEAIRSLMLGTEIIIIDPEREYDRLCASVDGAYISFSQDKGDKMNPFELSGLGNDTDELRMKMLSLQGFFKLMMGDLSAVEIAILDRALILTYREKGITLDPATQKGKEFPLLEDLYKVLKGMAEPEARSMASRLERYIIGSAAGIFNEKSTVELNNPFTVFSIRDMPAQLRAMVMYLMLDFIWTKVRMDQKRRILIVDEAWYMMQHEDSAKFLYGIAKRARKYYLGLTTITQDVTDFLGTDLGKAIITNSSIQFLMKQSPTAAEQLQRVFNLSEGERRFLLNTDQGQGLFFAGQNHVAIQVVSSQAEHELITSDPRDLERLAKKDGLVDTRSLEELAQLYSPGVANQPVKESVTTDNQLGIKKAVLNRKSQVENLYQEKLNTTSEVQEGQQVRLDQQDRESLFRSISDDVIDARREMNRGRKHLTPQGIVGDIKPTDNPNMTEENPDA